jgi:hypothetical protein
VGPLVLLEEALAALDRSNEARRLVGEQGLTTTTERSGVVHMNPLAKVEKESREQFARAWKDLGLSHASSNGWGGLG